MSAQNRCFLASTRFSGAFFWRHRFPTHSLQTVQASIKLYSHSSCNIRIATRAHHIGKRKAQAPRQAPCALVLRAACGTPLPNARRGLPKEPCAGCSLLHKGTKQAGPPAMLLCMRAARRQPATFRHNRKFLHKSIRFSSSFTTARVPAFPFWGRRAFVFLPRVLQNGVRCAGPPGNVV